jgi:hypothetical protein
MVYTTIQITKTTRENLNKLKPYKRATYDEVIDALMALIPAGDDEGEYTDEFRTSLVRGLLDIKNGRTYTTAEVKKQLGI